MTLHYPASVFSLDNTLKTIVLHGHLAERYGREHQIAVASPREAIRALTVGLEDFSEVVREGHYQLILGDEDNGLSIGIDNIDFGISASRPLHIVPVPEGAKSKGLGKVLAGVAMVGLAFATGGTSLMATALPGFLGGMSVGSMVGMMGFGMALGGLAQMLAPTPKLGDYSDREEEKVSYLFTGVVNTSEEGGPVAVALGGPLMVGSHVASSGLDVDDTNLANNYYRPPPEFSLSGGSFFLGAIDYASEMSAYNQWMRETYNDQTPGGNKGGKGGGNAKAAREYPTTVTSEAVARVLDLISAGEIEGWEDPDHPWRNVYLDETVVENPDGTRNFSGLEMDIRQGQPGQDYIPGFSQTENTNGVGVQVLASQPITRTITSDPATGLKIDRVKVLMRFPSLTKLDTQSGDLTGASVSYRIGIIPNGGSVEWIVNETLNEKFTSNYQRAHTLTLPDDGHPYQIRVQRMTPDSQDSTLSNETHWDAYVEIIDGKLSYPGSAMVGLTAYARQFGDRIPSRGYMIKGVICEVPSNYDPIKRTYTGMWDGTFQRLWTNNPGWILWNALVNQEWGIGKRVPRNFVDKWGFYEIANYCDKFVSDGLELPGSYKGAASLGAQRKDNVRVATRTNWAGGGVVDGVTLANGDRVLLMGQSSGDNGILQWNGSALIRSTDNDTAAEAAYSLVTVTEGTKKGRTYLNVRGSTETPLKGVFVSVHPRFQFNMWINSRETVYKAMQTIAQSFRGMLMWGRGMVMSTMDAPKNPRRLVTNANVHGGVFNYEGMGRKSIHSVALVTWVNPDDGWKPNVEVVENPELVAKYGWRPVDVFAAGCTNRAQARRMGTWTLFTEQYESELVSFKASLDFADIVPGDVIQIADSDQIGLRMGGRLSVGTSSSSQTTVKLDAAFTFKPGVQYTIYLVGADGNVIVRQVTNSAATTRDVTFSVPITSNHPQGGHDSVFILTSSEVDARLFRVMGVVEHADNEIEIMGAEHHPEKYAYTEEGILFEPTPTSVYDSTVLPSPPTDLDLEPRVVVLPGGNREELLLKFKKSDSILVNEYVIRWRYQFGTWTEITSVSDSAAFPYMGPGQYDVIVYGRDVRGKETVPVSYSEVFATGRVIPMPTISGLKIVGQPVGVTSFAGSVLRLEWAVTAPNGFTASEWLDPYFKDYQVRIENGSGTVLQSFFTTDPYFEITAEKYAQYYGSRSRTIRVSVALRDKNGNTSGFATGTFTNPPPSYLDIPATVTSIVGQVQVAFTEPQDADYAGIVVWASTNPGVVTNTANVVWDSRGQPVFNWPEGQIAYLRWAFYDDFGKNGLVISPETSVSVPASSDFVADLTPPGTPTGLSVVNMTPTVDAATGQPLLRQAITWNANSEADLGWYEIERTEAGGIPVVTTHPKNRAEFVTIANKSYSYRVLAVDKWGNRSGYTTSVSLNSSKDNVAPGAPPAPTVTALFASFGLTWTNVADADLKSVQIWVNQTNNTGTAARVGEVDVAPSRVSTYVYSSGGTRYFWLKSVDTSGNVSGFGSVAGPFTAKGIEKTDFTPGLVPIETVTSLPTSGNTKDRTVRFQDKLYTWTSDTVSTGTTYWKTGVDASDISGTIVGDQILNLAASKLTGQVISDQIAGLTASKIAGQITNAQIEGLTASKISGQITNAQIEGLTANKISGQITSAQIEGLTADKITTQLTSAQIASIAADKISGQITNAQIVGIAAAKLTGLISETQITDGAISTPKLAAGSVVAGKLAANSVSSDNVIANSIGSKHLIVTDWTNLISNGDVSSSNLTMFSVQSGSVLAYEATGGYAGNARLAFSKSVLTDSKTFTQTNDKAIRVAEGEVIYAEWTYKGDAAASAGAYFRVEWLNEDYSNISASPNYSDVQSNAPITTAWVVVGRQMTVPAGAKWARARVYNHSTNTTASTLYIGYLSIRKANSGKLIVDGSISANMIAAQSITGSKLYIGDTSNIFPDPDLIDIGIWETGIADVPSISTTSVSQGSRNLVHFGANAASTKIIRSKPMQVLQGAVYNVSAALSFQGAAATSSQGSFGIEWYSIVSDVLTWISSTTIVTGVTTQSATRYQSNITAPANARVARFYVERTGGASDPRLNLMGPVIRRASSGELIVDGAITANKIQAGSITGDRLLAGTITTSLLAAKAITVDKLAVTSMDNLIANGMFQSDVQGNFPAAWSRYNSGGGTGNIVVVKGGANWPVPAAVRIRRETASSVELSAVADRYGYEDAEFFDKGGFLVLPGDEFYVESYVYSDAANTARIEVLGKGVDGGYNSSFQITDLAFSSVSVNTVTINTSGWVKSVWTFKSTAAVPLKVALRFWNLSSTAAEVYFGNILVRRRNTGQLIVDGAITTNKILAGTITGDKIAANTITTSKLYIGDTTNVFTDANQAEPSLWSLNTAPDAYTHRHNSAYASDFVWRIPASATATKTMYSPLVTVDPGKPYFFSIIAALTGAANGGAARVTIDWYTYEPQSGNLTYVGGNTIANNTTTTQSRSTGIWSAPANANRMRLIYTRDPGGTGDALFIEPIVRRASNGELIVDGGITANKIQAGTITGDRLVAGTITTSLLAAKAITVDKLAVTSTDNIIPNGTFEADAVGEFPTGWSRKFIGGDNSNSIVVAKGGTTWPVPSAVRIRRNVAGSAELSAVASAYAYEDAEFFEKGGFLAIPGDEFYVESYVYSDAADTARIEVIGKDVNGQLSYSFTLNDLSFSTVSTGGVTINTSGWVRSIWTFKYTGSTPVKIGLRFSNRSSTANKEVYFGNILVRRRNTGQLIVDGAITTNKILAGTITGDKIAANTITTSKLYIGDTTNVFPDPNQVETSLWPLNTASDAYQYRHNSAYASDFVWRIPAGASTKTMYSPMTIVDPDREYFMSIVAALAGSSGGAARVTFDWYYYEPQSGNLTYVGGGTIATNATATQSRSSGIWKAPANANRMRLLYTRDGGGTSDAMFIEPIIRRAASGELIVDGAITANKIRAGTITGDRLVAGTITTSLLAAQAITVDKLAVTSMDNLIANGMFQSDVQGNFPGAWSRNVSGGGSGTVQVVKGGASWPVPAAVRLRRNTASSAELNAVADRYAYEDSAFYEKGGFLAAPGDEFYVESYVYSDAANIARIEVLGKTVTGSLTSEFTLQDLAFSSVNSNTVNINTSGWIKSVWTFRYYGATTAKVALRFWNLSATASHEVYFGNILVRRRNSGQLIVDGAITTNKIMAGAITADRIQSGAITSTQIAAGTITTSNLRVVPTSIFPDPEFMELGTGMWPTVQGWYPEGAGGGNVPQNIGIKRAMILWSGAGTVSGRFHIFSKWLTGLTGGQVVRLRVVGFNSSNQTVSVGLQFRNSATGAEQYPGGVNWQGTDNAGTRMTQVTVPTGCDEYRLVVFNEGNNTYNGLAVVGGIDLTIASSADMLVDGTITASKIVAGSITGDRIAANTITGNNIQAKSITARTLAIGNFDNIIPDSDYRDVNWWTNEEGSGGAAWSDQVLDANGAWSQNRHLVLQQASGQRDFRSSFFPIEVGATYKVTFRFYLNELNGNNQFTPYIHVPSYQWQSFRISGINGYATGGSGGHFNDASTYNGPQDTGDVSYTFYNPPGVGNNANRQIQFRWIIGSGTGKLYAQVKIVRISDATLIADGSITTSKVQANSIDADRLRASNITVGLNVGGTGKIRLEGQNNRIVISD